MNYVIKIYVTDITFSVPVNMKKIMQYSKNTSKFSEGELRYFLLTYCVIGNKVIKLFTTFVLNSS